MITIKDIAERAGVSFSTVSKALRDSPLVKPDTKRQIIDIAKEMGYTPNIAARRLVSKKSGAIGVVWPSIQRAALSSLLTALNENLEAIGYTMLLSMSQIEAAVRTFHKFQVDAIVVFGDQELNRVRELLRGSATPVLVYGTVDDMENKLAAPARQSEEIYSTVDVNRGQAIAYAVQHLAELGHGRIAFIGEPEAYDPLQAVKIDSFRATMQMLALPLPAESIVKMKGLAFQDGYWAALSLLKQQTRATAIISAGIDLTRGILRAASELELRIPHDLSVVSYDHLPEMSELDIPMTVVGVDVESIAASIAKVLLTIIADPAGVRAVNLEPKLIVRSSTSTPPAEY